MLRRMKKLEGYALDAEGTNPEDKPIGRVKDVLFDSDRWVARYIVLDTGTWLPGRKVVIPFGLLGTPDWNARTFPIDRTREQIENGPPITAKEPVSRQKEKGLYDHFGLPYYWVPIPVGAAVPPPVPAERDTPDNEPEGEPHLRSVDEVTGYHINAADGDIGHVEDLLVDDENWHIRYMIVDTRNWLPGKKVLLSVEWFDKVSWGDYAVHTSLTKDQIENSPEWDPEEEVGRPYEEVLYDHYGELRYWD